MVVPRTGQVEIVIVIIYGHLGEWQQRGAATGESRSIYLYCCPSTKLDSYTPTTLAQHLATPTYRCKGGAPPNGFVITWGTEGRELYP